MTHVFSILTKFQLDQINLAIMMRFMQYHKCLEIGRFILSAVCVFLISAFTLVVPVQAAPEKQQNTFNVFEFRVEGNSAMSSALIEEALYPYLGEQKSIQDVEKARAALEKVYQDQGYLTVSVSIPEQNVNEGVVQLDVLEGKVDRLKIKDSKYNSLAEIKSRTPEFAEGSVPHFPTAEKELATLNRNQNRQVTPVLRPGKTPGKVEVELQVQDKLPFHGSVELNDRYSYNTTRTRLNMSARYDNLWQKDHSLGINMQVTPEDTNQVKVFSATYSVPRDNGDYIAAYGVISDSDIAFAGNANVVGNGYIAGLRYIHPLPAVEGFYHSFTAGADYKVFNESQYLSSITQYTPISYLSFSGAYDMTFSQPSSQVQLTTTLNFAPRGMGNETSEFNGKNITREPNYAYLKADLKYTQKWSYDWATVARLSAQFTNKALITPEQFAIGGADSVRGYTESTSLGDGGILGSLELRTPDRKSVV